MAQSSVIIVALDKLTTIRAGAITLDTFYQMFLSFLDTTSYFHQWYTHLAQSENIAQQYDKLRGALYFDRHIDSINKDLDAIFNLYERQLHDNQIAPTYTKVPWKTTPHAYRAQKIQTGSGGDEDDLISKRNKYFIVNCIKYITNSDHISDFISDTFITYLQNLHKIDNYRSTTDNAIKAICAELLYYNGDLAIMKFLIYELDLQLAIIRTGRYNDDVSSLIRRSIEYLIKTTPAFGESMGSLENMEKILMDIFKVVNKYNLRGRVENLQTIYQTHHAHTQALFRKLATLQTNKIKVINEKQISAEIDQIRSIISSKEILTSKSLSEIPFEKSKTWYLTEQDRLTHLKDNAFDLQNISNENSVRRLIFLIRQLQTDGDSYAIKIGTDNDLGFRMEGNIYKRFRQIVADNTETHRDLIKKHILSSYSFESVSNALTSSMFIIYLTDDKNIIVTPTINKMLYYAIQELAYENGVERFYYYTMENLLGEKWNTLATLKLTFSDNQICTLMIDVFHLLTYLNEKYQFIHWDLHTGNIFVDETDPTNFKIFDFDFSEIQNNDTVDMNTSINNRLFTFVIPNEDTRSNYLALKRIERNNIGLIFDIYRVFRAFPKISYTTCNDPDLNILLELKNSANPMIDNKLEEENQWRYILFVADIIDRLPYNEEPATKKIKEMFAPKQQGGGTSYRKKYYKYKYKYLNLIQIASSIV